MNPTGFRVQVLGHIIYVSDLHLLVFRLRQRNRKSQSRGFKSLSDTTLSAHGAMPPGWQLTRAEALRSNIRGQPSVA
jgi:hypothetical protein